MLLKRPMRIVKSVLEMQREALALKRRGARIGLVPTMGCLHEGHLSLFRIAKANADTVIVSIFVNPLQFGPREDFERYPRDLARDAGLCEREKADFVFAPSPEEMYAPGRSVFVDEALLSRTLCGVSRPGHFRGVLTVVAKLFNICLPDVAVFGQKDAQQAALIRRMVKELNFPIEVIVAPTVREPDGLAASSRNKYLSAEERRDATCLYQSLLAAERLFKAGERNAAVLKAAIVAELGKTAVARLDYAEIVDAQTMQPVERLERPALAAVAAFIGGTRLIDNIPLG